MKKFKLLLVALMGFMSVTFVSCDLIDDSTDIVGTWEAVMEESYDDCIYQEVMQLTFGSEGSFVFEYWDCAYENGELYGEDYGKSTGTYTYIDNWLTIAYTGGEEAGYSESINAVVDGDELYLYDEDGELSIVYTRY